MGLGNCTCVPGSYVADAAQDVATCQVPCPTGATCPGGTSAPVALPGYAPLPVSSGEPPKFGRCPNDNSCLGASQGCAVGYTGTLCKDCESGYFARNDGTCTKCPIHASVFLITIFLVIILLGVLSAIFTITLLWRDARRSKPVSPSELVPLTPSSSCDLSTTSFDSDIVLSEQEEAQAQVYQALEADPQAQARNPSSAVDDGDDNGDDDGDDDDVDDGDDVVNDDSLMARLRSRRVPHSASLALVAWQTVGVLSLTNLEWPSEAESTLRALDVFALDFRRYVTCSVSSSYNYWFLVSILAPPLFLASVILTLLVFRTFHCFAKCVADVPPIRVSAVPLAAISTMGPVVYIPLARISLAVFDCRKLDNGKYYVEADLSLQCLSSEWFQAAGFSALAVLVYVIGIPAVIGSILVSHRNSLFTSGGVIAKYGGLYKLYRKQYVYMLLLQLGRRLLIVVVVVFVSSPPLLLAALLVIIGGLGAMQAQAQPYFFRSYDKLESRLNICLIGVLLCGMVFHGLDADRYPNEHAFVFVVFVTLLAALALVSVVHITRDVRDIRSQNRSASTAPFDAELVSWLRSHIAPRLQDVGDVPAFLEGLHQPQT